MNVRVGGEPGRIYKLTDHDQIGEYQARLEGVVAPEKEGWMPWVCVSPPVLAGEAPGQELITRVLAGFEFVEVGSGAYFSSGTRILLTDAFPRNVRIEDGEPALFDVVAAEPKGEVLEWLVRRALKR